MLVWPLDFRGGHMRMIVWAKKILGQENPPTKPTVYTPIFFTSHEYATVEQLCDLIIPADPQIPGAKAAGVSEFVDFVVANDPTLQPQFRHGLAALDQLSSQIGKQKFLSLEMSGQCDLLKRLAYRSKFRHDEESEQQFFLLIRKYCVMGFYTSEIGFKALDSPSLKFYAESPGCPHPDDPEHLHLEKKSS